MLVLSDHMISISDYVLRKTLVAFYFDETYTKFCTNNRNIMCQKTLFSFILQLIACFQFQNMMWKTEECHVSKNIELKI